MAAPYLLFVNSRPIAVHEGVWEKFYVSEHLPDLVNHKASTRAVFYREDDQFSNSHSTETARKYLALYESEHTEPLKSSGYIDHVRKWSDLFPPYSEGLNIGEFNGRNYELVQDTLSKDDDSVVPPAIATVELESTDHLHALTSEATLTNVKASATITRVLVYAIGPRAAITIEDPRKYLVIFHLTAATNYQKVHETIQASEPQSGGDSAHMRVWKTVHSEGY